ncbi:zinc finger MYM-type protein 1-like [Aphis craccivora]|uniref:Zinc finger MYM-type protein 1-like n=1 Tax=Aphis craccivora TaxID=307492 RepID=A0A6G0W6A2_APHCR|nr:zinc finger MYM-type protein 1-like [Aphis craccivora]
MHRKRLSGAQYKKAAREKEEREKKAINQTIKLDKFLYVKNIDDANQTNVNSRHSSSTVLDQSNDVIPTDGVEINNVISSSESEFPNLTAEEIIKLIPTDSVEIINKITSNFESETPNLTTKEIIHETISTPETCNILESSFSFNKDPAFWTVNEHARYYFSINGFDVNIYKNCDFINSKLESRCMTKNMFERLLPYGEKIESRNDESYLSMQGFNDWKNAQSRFKQHECSTNHRQSLITMKTMANLSNRIDKKLFSQLEDEISYWKNILRRVVAVIKSLSSRGLPFRGQNEVIGSVHNGNFLMAIELVAQFDPFLAQHISRYGNPGSGHTSHKANDMKKAVLDTLESLDISISDCRGQAYDTANNMSGRYNGLQAKIKELNPLAVYIPCAAHSLNLVGTHAVQCSNEATQFFLHELDDHQEMMLVLLGNDNSEPAETRNEASGLRKKFEKLETTFMAIFWGFILNRLNLVSKKLQSVEIDITVVLKLYDSLINLILSQRDNFDEFEKKAILRAQIKEYKTTISRKKKRTIPYDESRPDDVQLTGRNHFRINTYLTILDKLNNEHQKRHYEEFEHELLHFRSLLISKYNEGEFTALKLLEIIYKDDLKSVFPNIEIILRIYISTPATNCTAERSFSSLKRIKTYLRSKLGQEKLNSLAILTIESEMTEKIQFEDIIQNFVEKKARRKQMK